ncbi:OXOGLUTARATE/IRON-DEPENDENT DIOXYGENASE [Salix purpurea]|uniref:aminocyclopropanecarboxylate oxidase n=1 Tax=Salix purpurea TaxID=77065 RepID=A0A9Q0WX89_SALPP|nr:OXOGLUTARATE/IRON-DEPENDENT DIOXYGENASE [Salix purpurea]
MAIPVIDFSKINGTGEERAKTMAQIANGCEEWGFFQLMNHGIPEELLERVKKVCSEYFKLEREETFKNSTAAKTVSYLAGKKNGEKLENVDWEDVITLLDNNEWPSKTPGFKETMTEYRAELKKLAEKKDTSRRHSMMEKETVPSLVPRLATTHHVRIPELVNGLRAHTDAGGVILLFQDDEVGGLQILKDGQWIDVQPMKNTIVINTGDQIEVLSNGRYKSTWHRVLATPDRNRRSIASFYNPSLKATVAPAPALVVKDDEKINQTYPKFLFGDYMSVYAEQKVPS